MKSIATFYVLVAMEQAQEHAARHRAESQEARSPRPSILARARAVVAGRRATGALSNPI